MIPLLELALDAHGGLTRWLQVKSIDLKLSIGGQLWHAKGLPQGLNASLHVEPSTKLVVVSPFDGDDSTGYSTPDRVWVENAAGLYTAGPLARVAPLVPLSFDDCAACLLRAATDEPNWIG